jgi:hypothetical protein
MASFSVHSTFRNARGNQVFPHGLEWDLAGESFVSYVPTDLDNEDKNLQVKDTPGVRRAILEAHNRWCFAKDLPFRTMEEMEHLILPETKYGDSEASGKDIHYYVQWKKFLTPLNITQTRLQEAKDVIKNDPSALGDRPPAEVWINGIFQGMLHPSTLSDMLDKVEQTPSLNLSVKRSDKDNVLRVERRFRGGLRHKQDIFDHMVDNLYALEDVTILQDNDEEIAIIGSATLPDWIMGGDLTSRLHVRVDKKDGSILFLRPLYNDDLQTSDRKFRLQKGVDEDMVEVVQRELERLIYLAKLPLPFPKITCQRTGEGEEILEVNAEKAGSVASVTFRERQHRRNRRRFFGM